MTDNGYAHPQALVDTHWVASHGQDPNVRLIEVDVDTSAYDAGHIAGAVGWHWQNDLQRRPQRDIPTKSEWEALLPFRYHNETTVCLRRQSQLVRRLRLLDLQVYGHADVRLMNGGRASGSMVRAGHRCAERHGVDYHAGAGCSARAYRKDVESAVQENCTALVDVLATGVQRRAAGVANLPQEGAQRGHIPARPTFRGERWSRRMARSNRRRRCARCKATRASQAPRRRSPTAGSAAGRTHLSYRELLGYENVRNYDGADRVGSLIGAPIELIRHHLPTIEPSRTGTGA